MNPLLTLKNKFDITNLINVAENNVQTLDMLKETMEGKREAIGYDKNHTCHILGYRVVFSIEEQPIGNCRHISISNETNVHMIDEINTIIKAFGFVTDVNVSDDISHKYLEETNDTQSINIIEKI